MRDYEELVKRLIEEAREADTFKLMEDLFEAADAIEELQQTVEHYKGCADDWYRDACDYKAICEQMKETIIVEAQHTEMYDERDKKTLIEMAKSLPLQIIPYKNKKPRWIPVTERLPEDRHDVLVYAGVLFPYITVGYYDEIWKFSYNDEKIAGGADYWMPLPKPPKEMNE